MSSILSGAIGFLEQIGIYSVILPFLLVFTVVFAMLERTKVLGVEKLNDKVTYSKKSLNAMVAFCSAFFVIASSQLVSAISIIISDIVLLIVLTVFYLMLIGTLYYPGEIDSNDSGLKNWFGNDENSKKIRGLIIIIYTIAMIAIFLHAFGWLEKAYKLLKSSLGTNGFYGILFLAAISLFIWFISRDEKEPKKKKE